MWGEFWTVWLKVTISMFSILGFITLCFIISKWVERKF